MLSEKLLMFVKDFQKNLKKIDEKAVKKCILTNETDLSKIKA